MRSAKLKLQFDPQLPRPQTWSNPVVPGDHPDPTIIRVGRTFWASATSAEWSPQFPLFRSTDLVHWTPAGSIFPHQPAWAEGSFWAPELVHDEVSGLFICWYVARQRNGPLSIAVASASAPGGPYTDHGTLVSQPDGAIDPCFARDEHGEPFLIWKEDGNSVDRPTPIWAQPLTEDLLRLTGEKTMLITNDQPWEDGVVEGPYILRHQLRFYLFYAGNTCCGRECKYAEGVARSDSLLGPWEKFPGNPLIPANNNWRCPGHGTVVHTPAGKSRPAQDFLLYHAYPAGGTIYVGREALLDEVTWSKPEPDGRPGWPIVNAGHGPGEPAPAPDIDLTDFFRTRHLGPSWQWPVNTHPGISIANRILTVTIPPLSPLSDRPVESAIVAVPRPASLHYQATITLLPPSSPEPALWAGLTIIGDPFNTMGLGLRGSTLSVWYRRGAHQHTLWEGPAPAAKQLFLRAAGAAPENHVHFQFSVEGQTWKDAGDSFDASELPAWDRGLRIGILLEGPQGLSARFKAFELRA